MKINRRIYRVLKTRMFKVPEGCVIPKALMVIKAILFPIDFIKWYMFKRTF